MFWFYGIVCEQGWLGYGGNRYLLYTDDVLNFSDARELHVYMKLIMQYILVLDGTVCKQRRL